MWWDADIDALMARTRLRPMPPGLIEPREALYFGLTLSLLAVLTLARAANFLAAALLAFTIFFYVVIYTMWLKRLDAAEHRDRRRGGRLAAGGRLRGGERFGEPRQPRCCSRSSSCGRRRISGRWPSSRAATTSAPASR